MTKTKFFVVVVSLNVVVVGLYIGGCVLFFSPSTPTIRLIGSWMVVFMHILYIAFCMATYAKILFILINSRRNIQNNPAEETASALKFLWTTLRQQGYVVPFFITLTYLVFVVVPLTTKDICGAVGDWNCVVVALQVFFVTSQLNNVSDALIYIFGDKEIRRYLKGIFTRNQQVDDNRNNNNKMRESLL